MIGIGSPLRWGAFFNIFGYILAEIKRKAGENALSMTEKAFDEAFEKGFNYDIMQEIRETYSDELKEELKSGRAREESKEEFIQRASCEGMGVYEGKTATYGFRRVGDTAEGRYRGGFAQNSRRISQIKDEFSKLGIQVDIIDGEIYRNKDGITRVKRISEAATLGHRHIVVNYQFTTSPRDTAGHEAFHLWKSGAGREEYIGVIEDNLIYSSDAFVDFQTYIARAYFGGDIDIADEWRMEKMREEIFAYISGQIHDGSYDAQLRPMFRNYDAVKAAWYELIRKNR